LNKLLTAALVGLGMIAASPLVAAERTITLAVQNMYCSECPFIVRKSLEAVPGVANVSVSYQDKTAIVRYDDGKADVTALVAATTNAGYPSAPKS